MKALQKMADGDVENIFLFISDSVRRDITSGEITDLGVSGRAIAPSLMTASSFPSLITGQYPTSHRIWDFNDCLPQQPPLLTKAENFGMAADTIWTNLPPSEKPPFKMIKATKEDAINLSDLDVPFVAIEHHKGGHAPYGYLFEEYNSTQKFYTKERPSRDELPKLYEKSVRTAESDFINRVHQLKSRNILEDTLVIYTSDHGETLGEPENGTVVGHGHPMVPDLVDVPVIFAGAGLPNTKLTQVVSGTDIAPTALSAIGESVPCRCDGYDLWSSLPPNDRLCRSERWKRSSFPIIGETEQFRASSVWDDSGGLVFNHGNHLKRMMAIAVSKFIYSPESYLYHDPRQWTDFVKSYFPSIVRHGDPKFSEREARSVIEPFRESQDVQSQEIDKEQLRNLGYLN